jgi:hypothetical protein
MRSDVFLNLLDSQQSTMTDHLMKNLLDLYEDSVQKLNNAQLEHEKGLFCCKRAAVPNKRSCLLVARVCVH